MGMIGIIRQQQEAGFGSELAMVILVGGQPGSHQ